VAVASAGPYASLHVAPGSQTLLQLFFQVFHELIQSGLHPSLVGNFLFPSAITLKLIQIYFITLLHTIVFKQTNAVNGCCGINLS